MQTSDSNMAAPGVSVEAVGQSEAFMDFQERLAMVAPVERPVLLLGERGTGKEMAATRLHYLSQRWEGPFISLNCAALTPSLIEAELFGHEKGAFTGAGQRRTGRFESADGGSLFLDEIGLIPPVVQEKILRVVEYGVFERVGSSSPVAVDVRIIGATNADLAKLVEDGRFKRDLLDRLSFEALFLPPLRVRKGDILLLAEHFARRMAGELGRTAAPVFSTAVTTLLERHPWPGNIRELKNVVERAVYRTRGDRIRTVDFEPLRSPYSPPASTPCEMPPTPIDPGDDVVRVPAGMTLKAAVARLERSMMETALRQTQYHQKKAASLLGLTYDQFRGLKRKHADPARRRSA